MNAQEMNDAVATLLEAYKTLSESQAPVIKSLTDTSIDIETRWAAYVTLCKANIINNEEPYGDGFLRLLSPDASVYDDLHMDRYCSMSFIEVYEVLLDEDNELDYTKDNQEGLDAWREHVLKSGLSSFTWDW